MNQAESSRRSASREAAEAQFARRLASCLDEATHQVPHDVAERLRFSRDKALQAAQRARGGGAAYGVGTSPSGAAILGFGRSSWWLRLASVLPLLALVGGLVLIQDQQQRTQISVAAEVDEALLGDDLPLTAYRDPGFAEFLKGATDE